MNKNSFYNIFLHPLLDRKDSDSISFCIKGQEYTYRQLYDAIEQISCLVNDIPEMFIGLYATDDIRTYAAIIALWVNGKTYIPLNPTQPKERHIEVINSVHAHYILSADNNYNLGTDFVRIISTSQTITDGYVRTGKMLACEVPDSTIAYILFTSGSTGAPKGVQITRGNIASFIDSMNRIGLDITSQDRCLQPFDLTFDFSVSGYVIPLVKGACIYTIPPKAIKFTHIAMLLEKYKLTVLQMVPSMVRNLLPYLDEIELSSVRYNIFCGEALTGKVLQAWHRGNSEMVSYNMYGPTENTVFCTYYIIDKDNIDAPLANNDIIGIGQSFYNSNGVLIDENGCIIDKANEEGELCLSGSQLTPGYWENEKENFERFFKIKDSLYYKTGDLCYYDNNFDLLFIGRKDFQVKINGFRVELGEIENRFSTISAGKFSVVIPYVNEQGNTELAIIIEGKEYNYKNDKAKLANELPAYEIPSKWLFLTNIPLNSNGKIDRKAIKQHFNL